MPAKYIVLIAVAAVNMAVWIGLVVSVVVRGRKMQKRLEDTMRNFIDPHNMAPVPHDLSLPGFALGQTAESPDETAPNRGTEPRQTAETHNEKAAIRTTECAWCKYKDKTATLYECSDWDGGIGFDYVRGINYCPKCGRELPEHYRRCANA